MGGPEPCLAQNVDFKARRRRNRILKAAKGFRGGRSRMFRRALGAVHHAWMHMYTSRKGQKRVMRRLLDRPPQRHCSLHGAELQPPDRGARQGRDRPRSQGPVGPRGVRQRGVRQGRRRGSRRPRVVNLRLRARRAGCASGPSRDFTTTTSDRAGPRAARPPPLSRPGRHCSSRSRRLVAV